MQQLGPSTVLPTADADERSGSGHDGATRSGVLVTGESGADSGTVGDVAGSSTPGPPPEPAVTAAHVSVPFATMPVECVGSAELSAGDLIVECTAAAGVVLVPNASCTDR